MGGGLSCYEEISSSVWQCEGNLAVNNGSASCSFPFTYRFENGSEMEIHECQGWEIDSAQPGQFWCGTEDQVGYDSAKEVIGICSCTEPEPSSTWVLGVVFSILSSVCTTVGTILQKVAHNINNAKPEKERAREFIGILFSPMWICAFFLMVLLPLPFDFVALALAAQSLLVVFAGLTIALNQLIAPCILGEQLSRIEIYATCVILLGLICTTTSGPKVDVNFNACELLSRYSDPDFLFALFTLSAMIGVSLYLIHFAAQTKLVVRLRPALFAFCAGGFGGIGNIVFKATGELAEAGIAGGDRSGGAWSTIHPYYHIVLIIFFATLQISHINQGLRDYDAILYIPLYNCMYIILSGTMGAVTYQEFKSYTPVQAFLFPLGVFITLIGILIMTQKSPGMTNTEAKIQPAPVTQLKPTLPPAGDYHDGLANTSALRKSAKKSKNEDVNARAPWFLEKKYTQHQ